MEKSLELLKKNIKKDDIVVCATSGGPDSMVLLNLLLKLRDELNLKIICAHVNHKLREESEEEEIFVKDFCAKNNIIFEYTSFDKYETNNIESEAHNRRYEFFKNLMKKYKANFLLTAHHGDDLIETILMKLTRGSSLKGYVGFDIILNLEDYTVLRPLVFYTKDEILEYAKKNNIDYRIDETNKSDLYTRNRYRNHVLPFLKEENNNVHLKYLKFNQELSENNEFIDRIVNTKYDEIVNNNVINIDLLKKEDIFIIKKVIYKYLKKLYKDSINLIETKHIESIISIINSNKPNIKINLPNNIIIQKQYNDIKTLDINEIDDYNIEIVDEVIVPYGKIKVLKESTLTNNYICYLNSSDIKLPLYVRNKKDGDKITLLGLNKEKKVKDIFINEKVDINKRNNYPVVVDKSGNVLWIPGIKKSKYDAIKTGKYDIILWYDGEE